MKPELWVLAAQKLRRVRPGARSPAQFAAGAHPPISSGATTQCRLTIGWHLTGKPSAAKRGWRFDSVHRQTSVEHPPANRREVPHWGGTVPSQPPSVPVPQYCVATILRELRTCRPFHICSGDGPTTAPPPLIPFTQRHTQNNASQNGNHTNKTKQEHNKSGWRELLASYRAALEVFRSAEVVKGYAMEPDVRGAVNRVQNTPRQPSFGNLIM